MKIDKKFEIVQRNTAEIIGDINGVLKKKNPVVYCGYETSGELHAGHLVTINKLIELQKLGFKVKVLFADWHTWLNRKGDWDFIHKEVNKWKKGFKAAGLNKAEFILGSKFQRSLDFIDDVLLMSLKTTINRALRSMQVVARDIEHAKVSQVIYPFMQIADVKHLKVDAVLAGTDQRKIYMLGVDGMFKEIDYKTPAFIYTPIIPSLKGPGGKMSSSDPASFISIKDSKKNIQSKINKAYCVYSVDDNPVLSIMKLIVFPQVKKVIIKRDKKYGGDLKFSDYKSLEKEFLKKKIHAADLKNAVASYLNDIFSSIRKKF